MTERGPTFVVAACIIRGGDILLAQRHQPDVPSAHHFWELPGGKVKFEESPREALVREIKEELGTQIELVRLLPHVQSNIYETRTGKIHSVVIAFECVLSKGSPSPRPSDPSINRVMWTSPSDIAIRNLLPGTLEFIECLLRVDTASYKESLVYVRLEREDKTGQKTDYWELRMIYDLWKKFNLFERHGNIQTRSTHYKLTPDINEDQLLITINSRVRSLAKVGYKITNSDDPRLAVGI